MRRPALLRAVDGIRAEGRPQPVRRRQPRAFGSSLGGDEAWRRRGLGSKNQRSQRLSSSSPQVLPVKRTDRGAQPSAYWLRTASAPCFANAEQAVGGSVLLNARPGDRLSAASSLSASPLSARSSGGVRECWRTRGSSLALERSRTPPSMERRLRDERTLAACEAQSHVRRCHAVLRTPRLLCSLLIGAEVTLTVDDHAAARLASEIRKERWRVGAMTHLDRLRAADSSTPLLLASSAPRSRPQSATTRRPDLRPKYQGAAEGWSLDSPRPSSSSSPLDSSARCFICGVTATTRCHARLARRALSAPAGARRGRSRRSAPSPRAP